MKILKDVLLLVASILCGYFLSMRFGILYDHLFPGSLGSGLSTDAARSIFGTPLAYIFFLTLLFTAFGGQKKYWWIIILLIPAAIFEVYFDFSHIYFPILLGLLGWLHCFRISPLLSRPNPQV